MTQDLRDAALEYHRLPSPGKIEVKPIKGLANQRDLALAYSPGVAYACEAIEHDPDQARDLTARGNLVAVISNGTAVLGLGAIGPLAAKPVMEGKGVLFKRFAGIDVFDIEVAETDPDRLVEIVASLEPTFGGINLEDIKAPECFLVERKLRERMNIPVFHDDQHGTAIIVAAAVLNTMRVVGKRIEACSVVAVGAGAAGIACLDLLVKLGLDRERILLLDRQGVIRDDREGALDPEKARYARRTGHRTLSEAIAGADIFLGLSGPGILTREMVASMAEKPLILALANPIPEILPEEAKAARDDCVIATGRSDYPNQVNNVLCFPFMFRGALDVGATTINDEMKLACAQAIADLATAEPSEIVAAAYGDQSLSFGPEYLIPKPFDPRLMLEIPSAVAEAAMASGVATRPLADVPAYRERLSEFVFKTGLVMRSIFERARAGPKRVAYAEGEDRRVLRAVQTVVDEGLASPVLIGRPEVIEMRIEQLGLRIRPDAHFELVNPLSDPRYREYWTRYHELLERKGVSPDDARTIIRTDTTAIGSVMVQRGEADALVCGVNGRYREHLEQSLSVLGLRRGVNHASALSALIGPKGTVFICDTYVEPEPSAAQIAESTLLAAEVIRRFGIAPKVALLSQSSFGSSDRPEARKMRDARTFIAERDPALEVEGEMHGDAALSEVIREKIFPNSQLRGSANLLVMPTLDAANIAFSLLKVMTESVTLGPILLGAAYPLHILTASATVRRVVNTSALAVVDAQVMAGGRDADGGGG